MLTSETLDGVAVLLNCARPFAQTASALMQACINAGADYLDITAIPGDISTLPEGPEAQQREAHRARAVAEVTGSDGAVARSVIETVNGYTYTPLVAVEAARWVLAGKRRPGFETPAKLLGVEFAESIAGTTITDL